MPYAPFPANTVPPTMAVNVEFRAPAMRFRRNLEPSMSYGGDPFGYQLGRWPGEPATFPVFWNPKLRTNNFLKSYGYPSENITAHFPRADTRAFLAHVQQRAIRIPTQFNRFGDMRGIPAVYVPTMAANNYGGPTQ